MWHSVQFSRYGGPEVLDMVEMTTPVPGSGEVVVEVMAAGLNPGESSIREGHVDKEWPARFPAGQGSDFAGFIARIGAGVTGWKTGDAVLGHTVRGAQANFVTVPAGNVIAKPERLAWEIAGSLYVAAATAWQAVQGANPGPGRTVLVHAAHGGVGVIAGQLAKRRGSRVIGTASLDSFDYLRQIGVIPVEYGPGFEERLRRIAPEGIDAELNRLGDNVLMNVDSTDTTVLQKIAGLVADRQIAIPVAAIYEFARVRDAYRELEAGHAHGKIVLCMMPVRYAHQKVHGIDLRASEATKDAPNRPPVPPNHEALPPVIGHRHRHPVASPAADRSHAE
ncbi:NADP-dependent oxidoreductase [Cryobacterium gelidum]|uniref:NADP-dependent oxidoreductase n=2 Tax=Cryobacterium gelidum TaxID=1259164 RepID=A0A4R9AZZ1_9MICO|nr:NADP-dependent oxidoreductase [Cryobacterium gelidum]